LKNITEIHVIVGPDGDQEPAEVSFAFGTPGYRGVSEERCERLSRCYAGSTTYVLGESDMPGNESVLQLQVLRAERRWEVVSMPRAAGAVEQVVAIQKRRIK